MELTDSLKSLLLEAAKSLKGHARRLFMARTVKELGPGGQRRAERERGWSRRTVRKGAHELARGVVCLDAFAARGRKRAEDHGPNLLTDMQASGERQSQADPHFRPHRRYTRVSAAQVRRQLSAQKGYTAGATPPVQTLTPKLNGLGYFPKQVATSQPPKKSQQLPPSLTRGTTSIRLPLRPRRGYGSRARPRPRSRSASSPVEGRVGGPLRRAIMTLRPTRR